MEFDFVKVGKETVLNKLLGQIQSKSNKLLQPSKLSTSDKLSVLAELADLSGTAHDILVDLRDNHQ
jgi:hypothetical protein